MTLHHRKKKPGDKDWEMGEWHKTYRKYYRKKNNWIPLPGVYCEECKEEMG